MTRLYSILGESGAESGFLNLDLYSFGVAVKDMFRVWYLILPGLNSEPSFSEKVFHNLSEICFYRISLSYNG